ncbi:DUF1993 domain-containing protein [Pseudomarimonas arenosa]|uniref:DUF1993 domain-containing protein n=1 Tax=Pseudomarimonas arenosa TaxID=2774145 RepID=A0AAW3ZTB1_9GAMM|nr:DUF1993 domain-containing protein [Pseudomarimonas arenosa]MBD8527632.1 DUF1993 domain-containing protein [Pseudomarimonas arenosa]
MSLYRRSVTVFQHNLRALDRMLSLAEANAEARGFEADKFLAGRLAPDMFPLTRQIQIACDLAKGASARLAGVEIPKHEDSETTLAELHARIAKVQDFIASLDADAVNAGEQRPITLSIQGNELNFVGAEYLDTWALPNFYFHLSTAYNLLRMQGVPLGKRDFLGRA